MAIEMWRPRSDLMRWPFRELSRIEREMEDMFGRVMREWPAALGGSGGRAPAFDMIDRPDELLVRADLPGLEQKDVEVMVEEGVLTIRGERKGEDEAKEADFYCCERWAGSFVRSLTLPSAVDVEKIAATFKNGVLEVHLPKAKAAKGTKIDVKAA